MVKTGAPERPRPCALDGEDIIVLRSGFTAGDDFFMDAIRRNGVSVDLALRRVQSRLTRALRRVHLRSALPLKWFWFGDWLRAGVESKPLIIVHAADLTLPAALHAARRFPQSRVIFWLWNPVAKGTDPARAHGTGLELWSFDSEDCRRYGMQHNSQFMFPEISELGADAPVFDLGFYGADKGRSTQLSELASQVQELGLSFRFEVVPDRSSNLDEHPLLVCAPQIPYGEMLKHAASARVVVDIVQQGQVGMTLRTVESLYLGRKLLTNLGSIRGSLLYDSARVFVLGEDPIESLPSFLAAPYIPPEQDVMDYYSFACWLGRFTAPDSVR